MPGTGYIVCRKHHPHDAPTPEKVLQAHSEALARRDAVIHDLAQSAAGAQGAAPAPGAAPTDEPG